jgi:SAM-dependent methyltransferase
MIPLDYLVLRILRRATPQPIVDLLLDRGIYLKPGRDTSEPERVAAMYAERAAAHGRRIAGATVCVVGYGGGYGVGLYLLEAGARHVILQDPFAPVREARNRRLPAALRERYLPGGVPDPDRLTLVHEPLETLAARAPSSVDLVVSSSVLEHVDDVDRLVAATATLTRSGGLGVHVVDLRDHYFKYPFEMLCHSDAVWDRFLDASNHLNRWRLPGYRRAFERCFRTVDVTVVEHLRDEFRRSRARIRPEFLTGDEHVDAAAIVRIEVEG